MLEKLKIIIFNIKPWNYSNYKIAYKNSIYYTILTMNSNIKQDGYTVLRKVFNKNELNFIIKNINFSIKKEIKLKKDINFSKGKVNTFHALKRNEKLLKFSKKIFCL